MTSWEAESSQKLGLPLPPSLKIVCCASGLLLFLAVHCGLFSSGIPQILNCPATALRAGVATTFPSLCTFTGPEPQSQIFRRRIWLAQPELCVHSSSCQLWLPGPAPSPVLWTGKRSTPGLLGSRFKDVRTEHL